VGNSGVRQWGENLSASGEIFVAIDMAETFALGAVGEKVVETGGVVFEWSRRGLYGYSFGHGDASCREHH
jgi:hypothetical protein